jgi:hypothetical protein
MNRAPGLLVVVLLGACVQARSAEPLLVRIDAPRFAADADAGNPVLADVDGNGSADLIVPVRMGVNVLLADQASPGKFCAADAEPVQLPHVATEMVAADLNRDGKIDLALASHDSYDVMVLLGNGAGRFTAAHGSPFAAKRGTATPHTHGLAAGDFDGDACLDLVLANNADGDLSLLLGDGHGSFASGARHPT